MLKGRGLNNVSEEKLLYRSLRGEKEAWGEIVKRYKNAVYGISLSILKDSTEAEDATQEAFIKAWENLEKYDMDRKFSTWLFTVASNISKNIVRKRDRWSFLKDGISLMSGGSQPQEEFEKERRRESIREALFSLEAKYSSPLVLRYWRGCSYEEIAQILDIPEGTVKTRLHRGKNRLREIYQKKEGIELERASE